MVESTGPFQEYIDGLPEGLASYPDCRTRGSLVRAITDSHPCERLRAASIADELRPLLSPQLPVSALIPEVHYVAFVCLFYELEFDSWAEFETFWLNRNTRLAKNIAYRALFNAIGPKNLVKFVGIRVSHFKKGPISMKARECENRKAIVRLEGPPLLYPDLIADAWTIAFKAFVAAAGGKDVEANRRAVSDTITDFHLEWR